MPRPEPLYQWAERVATRFPDLSRPQARALAWWSFGMALAQACGLDRVALALAALTGGPPQTVRQRLREFYRPAAAKRGRGRLAFDPAACFAPLLAWVTAGWPVRRVALAIDATALGDRLTVLAVSVVYRGCGVPVAWAVLRGNEPGAWMPHWKRLLGALRDRLGPPWQVLVLSDRGLESAELFRAIVGLGWHPLMRAKAGGCFRPSGWRRWYRLPRFAPRPGSRRQVRGQAYREPAARVECTLLARWDAGHEGPWLVLTDLAPGAADAAWYGWRSWIEQSFKVLKSGGWQWQRTATSPTRRGPSWPGRGAPGGDALAAGGGRRAGGGDPAGGDAACCRSIRRAAGPALFWPRPTLGAPIGGAVAGAASCRAVAVPTRDEGPLLARKHRWNSIPPLKALNGEAEDQAIRRRTCRAVSSLRGR